MAAGDFDGDGHDELLLLNQCGPTGYFLGHGDGTFTDASDRLAALDDGIRVGVTYGDYDDDGDQDFYVTFTRRHNALLRQNDDGTFTDVAHDAGVDLDGHYTGTAFVDADGDGDLDLLVAASGVYTTDEIVRDMPGCPPHRRGDDLSVVGVANIVEHSVLFINGGAEAGFAFTDESAERHIPRGQAEPVSGWYGDATFGDFDRDGAPDLVLSDMFGQTALLHNDGAGNFTNVVGSTLPRLRGGRSPPCSPTTTTTVGPTSS
jgi:hypothetical protein